MRSQRACALLYESSTLAAIRPARRFGAQDCSQLEMFRSDPTKQFIDGCFACDDISKMFHAKLAKQTSIAASRATHLRVIMLEAFSPKLIAMSGVVSSPQNDSVRPLKKVQMTQASLKKIFEKSCSQQPQTSFFARSRCANARRNASTSTRRSMLPNRSTSALLQHLPVGISQGREEQCSYRSTSRLIKPNRNCRSDDHSEHASLVESVATHHDSDHMPRNLTSIQRISGKQIEDRPPEAAANQEVDSAVEVSVRRKGHAHPLNSELLRDGAKHPNRNATSDRNATHQQPERNLNRRSRC